MGGLGNQLFQYAAARTWADERGLHLVLDTRYVDRKMTHGGTGDLRRFNLRASFAGEGGMPDRLSEGRWRLSRALRKFYTPALGCFHEIGQDPALNRPPKRLNGALVSGFWQSEQYFITNRDVIRSDISLREEMSKEAKALHEEIDSSITYSIHVRRGDYTASEFNRKRYGSCTAGYFQNAIQTLRQSTPSARAVLFSDDPAWAQASLNLPSEALIASGRNLGAAEELVLMASCNHHIIANSTFSWWGAWLNPSLTKQVIAPSPWFSDPRINSSHITPPSWLSIAKDQHDL